MQTDRDELAGELAYVRSLAEEGRRAPLVDGPILILWGTAAALASLLHYAILAGLTPLGPEAIMPVWIGVLILSWLLSVSLVRRSARKPGAMTIGNKTSGAVWFAVGLFMMSLWAGFLAMEGTFRQYGLPPFFLFNLIFPIGFGLYGVAYFVTATAAGLGWLRWFAVLAWASALAALALAGRPEQLLFSASALLLCAVLPGALIWRREPAEIV